MQENAREIIEINSRITSAKFSCEDELENGVLMLAFENGNRVWLMPASSDVFQFADCVYGFEITNASGSVDLRHSFSLAHLAGAVVSQIELDRNFSYKYEGDKVSWGEFEYVHHRAYVRFSDVSEAYSNLPLSKISKNFTEAVFLSGLRIDWEYDLRKTAKCEGNYMIHKDIWREDKANSLKGFSKRMLLDKMEKHMKHLNALEETAARVTKAVSEMAGKINEFKNQSLAELAAIRTELQRRKDEVN